LALAIMRSRGPANSTRRIRRRLPAIPHCSCIGVLFLLCMVVVTRATAQIESGYVGYRPTGCQGFWEETGASDCTPDAVCAPGPWVTVSAAARAFRSDRTNASCWDRFNQVDRPYNVPNLAAGGTLFLKGGQSYPDPVLLNRPMTIRSVGGPATIGPSALKAFDLIASRVDENGFPLNPKWGSQITAGVPPDPTWENCPQNCTGQFVDLDERTLDIGGGQYICGHRNWAAVTYEGCVTWSDASTAALDDRDYNMDLVRSDQAGYTTVRPRIHCEFESRETTNHFHTPWWRQFIDAVEAGALTSPPNWTYPKAMVDGAFAVVTGLMGLDDAHDYWSELHPVWALVMNVSPNVLDDTWVLFVRNAGDEGWCSTNQHFVEFPGNRHTVLIPWRQGATDVHVTKTVFAPYHNSHPAPMLQIVPQRGVLLTCALDPPREDGSIWEGEIHLQWTGPAVVIPPRGTACP